MNDSLASQQKSKKTGGDVLSARLLYLALKCPLLQGKPLPDRDCTAS